MKILMVNKFLYHCGGSETYVFKLGDYLKEQGNEVEYFGMLNNGNKVGNSVNIYTSNMDFHTNGVKKILYPFKIIYSIEARKKIRVILDSFNPDVVHLNNFNFQLTPSIIYEIKKYERENNRKVRIIFTAHDYQLICPNHMMYKPLNRENCEKCLGGNFVNCIEGRCIHGSLMKSFIGAFEGYLYSTLKTYKYIDKIICPSKFLADKMKTNHLFKDKIVVLHNFIDIVQWKDVNKEDYVLYFGRFSEEKGIKTLIEVSKLLPNIQFIFAGSGPLENDIEGIKNIKNVGFQSGETLEMLIRKARLTVYPSEWYENCPFSVMESQMYGTPVIGARIGGIPELIQNKETGELFTSGDKGELKTIIEKFWNDNQLNNVYIQNCKNIKFDTIKTYYEKLIKIYKGEYDENENIGCNS